MSAESQSNRGVPANGKEIITKRKENKWTQEQLAQRAGVDVKTIRRAEKGERIDVRTIAAIAEALEKHQIDKQSEYIILLIPAPDNITSPDRLVALIIDNLQNAIKTRQPIITARIERGSIKAILKMNADDIALLWLYMIYSWFPDSFPGARESRHYYLLSLRNDDNPLPTYLSEGIAGIARGRITVRLHPIGRLHIGLLQCLQRYIRKVSKYILPVEKDSGV